MALGDGATWNQALPDEDQPANLYPDYDRDLRVGVQGRMAREHIWPTSQTATSEGGHHNYITLQLIASAPSVGTAGCCLWAKSSDKALYIIDSAGTARLLMHSGLGLAVISGGTQGSIPICSSAAANTLILLTGSATGLFLRSQGATGAPKWDDPLATHFAVASGSASHGVTIASIAGFASNQCTVFVSINNLGVLTGGDNDDMQSVACSVNANRVVTCTALLNDSASITGTANYLIVGTK